jgi:hypothetical protein
MIAKSIPQLCKSTIGIFLGRDVCSITLGTLAGEEWLFKGQLLVVVASLVSVSQVQSHVAIAVMPYALQATKESLNPLIVPLVQESLSPGVRFLRLPDVTKIYVSEGCHQSR